MPRNQISMQSRRLLVTSTAFAALVLAGSVLTPARLWAVVTEKNVHGFVNYSHGSSPQAGLIADAAGDFYGTAASGGAHGQGAVFKLNSSQGGAIVETVLYSFTGKTDGAAPKGSLIFDAAGNLYGTTSAGGSQKCFGCGAVFELSPNPDGTWSEKVLHSFNGTDGSTPLGNLIFDAAGNLYGTTSLGGASSRGIAFELIPSGGVWKLKTLHNFAGGFGENPNSGLVFDGAGNLYGTTPFGGAFRRGTVFELSPSGGGWNETVLHSFNSTGGDGYSPTPGVIFDHAGNLYGATISGATGGSGTVYELSPSGGSWTETILYKFLAGSDGSFPAGGVTFDTAGNLYGTTQYGGGSPACTSGCGIAYQLALESGVWTETILHTFTNGNDGAFPAGNLALDASGNVWGTTAFSGLGVTPYPLIGGTAFKLAPSGGSWFETVYDFAATDGNNPRAGLISDSQGNFYGTTAVGGDSGAGAVFELSPVNGGWTRKVLYSFKGSPDGMTPLGELVFDQVGNLYGTTQQGGNSSGGACSGNFIGCGTVFKLSPTQSGQWKESVLYSFQNVPDGAFPRAGSAIDTAGNLYGTTEEGGAFYNQGSVFKLTHNPDGTWTESLIYSFAGTDGAYPRAALTLDAAGNLYGTTYEGGGSVYGTVFELSPRGGSWTESRLYKFSGYGPDGNNPVGKVSFDKAGNLYGTTVMGGAFSGTCGYGCGVVFKLVPVTGGWTQSVIHNFTNLPSDGAFPEAGVVVDSAGNLFGTTSAGGSVPSEPLCFSNCGTVYELSPANGAYTETVLYNFSGGADGGASQSDLFLDSAGNVFGTASILGVAQAGTVFEITP